MLGCCHSPSAFSVAAVMIVAVVELFEEVLMWAKWKRARGRAGCS